MGRVHEQIDDRLAEFLLAQHVFFVATAPLSSGGHVNVSPKGLAGTFRVLDRHAVAYLDLTGSGIETLSHLRENGRIVLMFCAFHGPPRIVRLHGTGEAVTSGDSRFEELVGSFPAIDGARSVILVSVERVSESCGYGVPLMACQGDRDQLGKWARQKGPAGIEEYHREKNAESIDSLPGLMIKRP